VNDLHKHELHACHECDLLLAGHEVEKGRKAVCPRCGAVLFENKPDTINRTLALTIAGLFLFLPANLLPILSLNIMGHASYNTMVGAVSALALNEHFLVAFLVLFCSVVAPFIKLWLLLLILAIIKLLDMAEVGVNLGMLCFIGLLVTYLGTKVTLEKSVVWKMIEAKKRI